MRNWNYMPAIGIVISLFSVGCVLYDFIPVFRIGIVVQAVFFLLGIYICIKPSESYKILKNSLKSIRKKRKEVMLFLITAVVCFVVLEAMARIISPGEDKPISKYGWNNPINTTEARLIEENVNKTREINVSFFDHGFKRWGDLNAKKKKVLVLGDSFTEAYVTNGQEYYAYIEENLPVELFVSGVGGYGSLQELMVLNDFISIINPDIIIWQFCNNDWLDNYYEYITRYGYPYGDANTLRPFLEEGKIVYRNIMPFSNRRKSSRFLSDLMEIYYTSVSLRAIERYHQGHLVYRIGWGNGWLKDKSLKVTIEMMKMAKKKAGDVPIYMFSVDEISEYEIELCKASNITCMPGIAEHIEELEDSGVSLKSLDGHWNVEGNRIAGELLVDYFVKNRILERKK